jgi:hypothetical protein
MLKLGKKPARPGAMKLKLSNYLKKSELPTVPMRFGNLSVWGSTEWGMLGNDQVGDCVFAGFAHQIMMWEETIGKGSLFVEGDVLAAYSEVTGYDPNDPSTDQGTDMVKACQWWKDNGYALHQIFGFAEVPVSQIAEAAFIFGSVGVGLKMTQGQQDQFNHAEPWDVTGDPVEGGHYVPVIGRNAHGNYLCVTWGRLQAITPAFIERACDEAVCQVSQDWLNVQEGMTPRGLKLADLMADMQAMSNS